MMWRRTSSAAAAVALLVAAGCGGNSEGESLDTEVVAGTDLPTVSESVDGQVEPDETRATPGSVVPDSVMQEGTAGGDSVSELEFPSTGFALIASGEAERGWDDVPLAWGLTSYGRPFAGPNFPLAGFVDGSGVPKVVSPTTIGGEGDFFVISPDGSLVAAFQPSTAVADGRFDFVRVATGEVVDSVDIPSAGALDRIASTFWSPDSAAFAWLQTQSDDTVHRIGGQTLRFDYGGGSQWIYGFASNETVTEFVICHGDGSLTRHSVTSSTGDGSSTVIDDTCYFVLIQTFDRDGNPAVSYATETALRYLAAGADVVDLPTLGADLAALQSYGHFLVSCGDLTIARTADPTLLDVTAGTSTVATGMDLDYCPVVNVDNTLAAYRTVSGTVSVVDLVTGAVTEVARSGSPIAFSSDGTRIAVEGGGLFLINADGSGATPSSTTIATGGTRWCAPGKGKVVFVATADGEIVILDIDTDVAVVTGGVGIAGSCSLSPDGRWAANGNIIVDLDTSDVWLMPRVTGDETTEVVTVGPLSGVANYTFEGARFFTASGR